MSLHIVILSGMDAKDTTDYLVTNGFDKDIVLENQIQRYSKVIGKENPIRITLWVALNSILTQHLMIGLKYRIKNILFLYHAKKPVTLIRAHGWWKFIRSTFDYTSFRMILCSTIPLSPSPNVGYERMISHIANKFLCTNEQQIPHYVATLKHIFKKFHKAIR